MNHFKPFVIAAVLLAAALAATSADAATRCLRGSTTYSGRCFTSHRIYRHQRVAEAVPLVNRSRHTATLQCSFTHTITRSLDVGASVSSEVKGTLFGLVDASTSITVHRTVTQTASQATQAGASVRLKPGERVTCERTYGYVTTRVTDKRYSGSHVQQRSYRVRVPSYLGVRLVD